MNKFIFVCVISLASTVAISSTFYESEISGYGVIDDKDGYVNLRKSPELSSEVIKKINNGTIVYCYNEGGRINDFCYSQTPEGKGYIHTSRILKLDNDFKTIQYHNRYVLENENKKIEITHTNSSKYNSICITNHSNGQDYDKLCIPSSELVDFKEIDMGSHIAYTDTKTENIYLIASNGTIGHIYYVVWKIGNDDIITRWIYDFEF